MKKVLNFCWNLILSTLFHSAYIMGHLWVKGVPQIFVCTQGGLLAAGLMGAVSAGLVPVVKVKKTA